MNCTICDKTVSSAEERYSINKKSNGNITESVFCSKTCVNLNMIIAKLNTNGNSENQEFIYII